MFADEPTGWIFDIIDSNIKKRRQLMDAKPLKIFVNGNDEWYIW